MEGCCDIALYGSALNIVRQRGPALGDILRSKFGCVATFDGVDFESGLSSARQKKPPVVEEKRFSVELNSGVKVSVWKADLTHFKVGAVVNAANSQLHHCGGLAEALSEAGGPQIQQDSDDYIQQYGQLETGLAIKRLAGLLPCKNIIHAVGPQLSACFPDVAKAEPLLKKTIWSILHIVKECSIKTVAIPAISSGLFNYPLNQCARTIVSAVKDYCERNFFKVPVEIMLVNHDEPTVREMESVCHQILTTKAPMSYSQAAGSSRTHAAKTSSLTVNIGNVFLMLTKGHIEEQQTNVIVNTISTDRKLNLGAISKTLNEKAGSGMQREIQSAVQDGYVIVTKGYRLHCKEVYHTCCTQSKKDTMQEILYQSVLECLRRAVSCKHTSISFPAIGTGNLGLDKKDVAFKMFKAVADFAQESQREICVTFVIFPSDNEIFKAFEKQMKCLQQQVAHPSIPPENNISVNESFIGTDGHKNKDDFKLPTPKIRLNSHSEEAVDEAKQWLSDHLFKRPLKVYIHNNFIQHFGEQEYNQLSRLNRNGISVQESFANGRASITVRGQSEEDVAVAALQVEAMLCMIRKEFINEEMRMFQMPAEKMSYERANINHTKPLLLNVMRDFKNNGLEVLKTEKVKNPGLEELFKVKKKQINCSHPQIMIQRVPAQFCEMVCHVGFHAECAPPENPEFGEGIYFARKVDAAMKLWKDQNDVYLYFVEAEVLTGKSTRGKPGLILPPASEKDPQTLYDSVNGGEDVSVIFSSYQALPKHIFTCKKVTNDSLSPMRAEMQSYF